MVQFMLAHYCCLSASSPKMLCSSSLPSSNTYLPSFNFHKNYYLLVVFILNKMFTCNYVRDYRITRCDAIVIIETDDVCVLVVMMMMMIMMLMC